MWCRAGSAHPVAYDTPYETDGEAPAEGHHHHHQQVCHLICLYQLFLLAQRSFRCKPTSMKGTTMAELRHVQQMMTVMRVQADGKLMYQLLFV